VEGIRGKTIQELLKEGRLADKVDKDRAELWAGMLKTEAWKMYEEMLNSRIQILSDNILLPVGSVDACMAVEYMKGAMSGLILARELPGVVVGVMAAQKKDDEDV
jgi:hypothetical protein